MSHHVHTKTRPDLAHAHLQIGYVCIVSGCLASQTREMRPVLLQACGSCCCWCWCWREPSHFQCADASDSASACAKAASLSLSHAGCAVIAIPLSPDAHWHQALTCEDPCQQSCSAQRCHCSSSAGFSRAWSAAAWIAWRWSQHGAAVSAGCWHQQPASAEWPADECCGWERSTCSGLLMQIELKAIYACSLTRCSLRQAISACSLPCASEAERHDCEPSMVGHIAGHIDDWTLHPASIENGNSCLPLF